MKDYIKNFFDKYLIIGTILYYLILFYSEYLSDLLIVGVLFFISFCLILTIIHNNVKIYSRYKKMLYFIALLIYCSVIFFTSLLFYLLFFADLSKI